MAQQVLHYWQFLGLRFEERWSKLFWINVVTIPVI